MTNTYFSDEELVAYLDGEAEFAPIDEIERALKTDVALAKRLDNLRIDTREVAESFQGLIDSAKKPPEMPAQQSRGMPYGQIAAAAVIALVIGFSVGNLVGRDNPENWMDYVAAYQALYTNSTLNHVDATAEFQQTELDRVASAIGKTIQVSSLTGISEIEYKRAQVLGFEGKALIQLAFLSSVGEPLALCILRTSSSGSSEPEIVELEGMSAAAWSGDGYEYLLIGGSDPSQISRLSTEFTERQI